MLLLHQGKRGRTLPRSEGYEKAAHLYDLFDTKENIQFFLHYGREAGEILDIGAGTGRIAIPLAERGVKLWCIEPSPAMRQAFLKKLSDRPDLSEKIKLVAGEAASFDLGRTFSAAFLSGSFDHLLNDEERLSALANIARHLNPGGKLVFDVFLGLMGNSPLSLTDRVTEGGREYRRFVGSKVLEGGKQETHLVYETYESGKLVDRIEERSLVGVIDREKLHRLLRQSGFRVNREFGDYDFTPFQEGEKLLIIETAKV